MGIPGRMVSATVAARRLGVSTRTLRRYTADGTLPDRRSPGGRRVFDPAELDRLAARRGTVAEVSGAVVLYARVSSHRQRAEGDLDRQTARLRAAAAGRVVVGEFTDVASGLSDQRKGLRRALRACQSDQVTALLVTHPQRLGRFGTALLSDVVLPSWGVVLEVVGDDELGGGDGDLVRDMLAVVTSFAGRLYGARSARARALVEAVKGNTRS